MLPSPMSMSLPTNKLIFTGQALAAPRVPVYLALAADSYLGHQSKDTRGKCAHPHPDHENDSCWKAQNHDSRIFSAVTNRDVSRAAPAEAPYPRALALSSTHSDPPQISSPRATAESSCPLTMAHRTPVPWLLTTATTAGADVAGVGRHRRQTRNGASMTKHQSTAAHGLARPVVYFRCKVHGGPHLVYPLRFCLCPGGKV